MPRRLLAVAGLTLFLILPIASLSPAAGAAAVAVPATIDGTGSTDVTAQLQSFLNSVPDGSTVVFPPGARYRVDGTLELLNRAGMTIEGRGSTFFATTEGERNRSHWKVTTSRDVVLRDVYVVGANEAAGPDGPFDADREAQHGFNVQGSTNVLLERVRASDVWGDFVYVDKHGGLPARGVTVRDSTFDGSGRQGIAISSGEDVLVTRNTITNVRRSMIDLEPYSERLVIRNIRIENNDIGPARFGFLASAGHGAIVENIDIVGNRFHGMLPSIAIEGKPEAVRRDITVANNVTDAESNRPIFSFVWVEGADITGNRVHLRTLKEGEVVYAVRARTSCGINVGPNDFGDAEPLDADQHRCGPASGSTTPAPAPAPAPAPVPAPPGIPAPTVPPVLPTAPGAPTVGGAPAPTAPTGSPTGDATAPGTSGTPTPGQTSPAAPTGDPNLPVTVGSDGSATLATPSVEQSGVEMTVTPAAATASDRVPSAAVFLALLVLGISGLGLFRARPGRPIAAVIEPRLEPTVEERAFGTRPEDLEEWLAGPVEWETGTSAIVRTGVRTSARDVSRSVLAGRAPADRVARREPVGSRR